MSHFVDFSPSNRLATSPASEPYSLFRNKERHTIGTFDNNLLTGMPNVIYKRQKSLQQVYYYHQSLSDHHIPLYLLKDLLFQEELHNEFNDQGKFSTSLNQVFSDDEIIPSTSTLITCQHQNRSYIVHAAGKNLDQLIIRDAVNHYPFSNLPNLPSMPSFTLNLTKGSEIVQVLNLGQSQWGKESHILVRTDYELYHIRTVQLSDEAPPEEYLLENIKDPQAAQYPDVLCMLEPLQRWALPEALCRLSASSCDGSIGPSALALTASGRALLWTPSRGFLTMPDVHINSDFFTLSDSNPKIAENDRPRKQIHRYRQTVQSWAHQACVASSAHPIVWHLSHRASYHSLDLRSRSPSKSIFSTPQNALINGLLQDPRDEHLLYTCYKGSVVTMDLRYTQTFLLHRYIPDSHSNLNFVDTQSITSPRGVSLHSGGLLVGSSKYGSQVFVHAIEKPSAGFSGVKKGFHWNRPQGSLLFGSGIFSCQDALYWHTQSYPVVDYRSSPLVHLSGSCLVPYPVDERPYRFDEFSIKKQSAFDKKRKDRKVNCEKTADGSSSPKKFNAALFQQSSLGDVFVQLILVENPNFHSSDDRSNETPENTPTLLWPQSSNWDPLETNGSITKPVVQLNLPCGSVFPSKSVEIKPPRKISRISSIAREVPGLFERPSLCKFDTFKQSDEITAPSCSMTPLVNLHDQIRSETVLVNPSHACKDVIHFDTKFQLPAADDAFWKIVEGMLLLQNCTLLELSEPFLIPRKHLQEFRNILLSNDSIKERVDVSICYYDFLKMRENATSTCHIGSFDQNRVIVSNLADFRDPICHCLQFVNWAGPIIESVAACNLRTCAVPHILIYSITSKDSKESSRILTEQTPNRDFESNKHLNTTATAAYYCVTTETILKLDKLWSEPT